jgi:hypothetical protein
MSGLQFVETTDEVRQNLRRFVVAATLYRTRFLEIAKRNWYWVYDQDEDEFGPSLFLAYRNMTVERYEECQPVRHEGHAKLFDGTKAREAISKLIGGFEENAELEQHLYDFLSRFISESALSTIQTGKWLRWTPKTGQLDKVVKTRLGLPFRRSGLCRGSVVF